MSHIARILVPVDLSPASALSSLYAVQLARAFQAEIVFLHVIPEDSFAGKLFFPPILSVEEGEAERETEEKEALRRLSEFIRSLSLKGVRHSEQVARGVPFVEILQAVEALHPDLVIQGTHGATGLETRVIGGTAQRVIRKIRCPVISIKPVEFGSFLGRIAEGIGFRAGEEGALAREAYHFPPRKVLFPTDFSEHSRLAMDYAAFVAAKAGAKMIVLHATEEREEEAEEGRLPEADEHRTVPEEIEEIVREIKALYPDLRITPHVVKDRPASAILEVVVREEIDIVVMGTHGRTGMRLMFAGSTADRVIRNAPCPVMTMRPNWKLEEVEKKFRKVFRRLSPMDLQRMSSEHLALIEDDIFQDPDGLKKSDLYLKFYSREGMSNALEEYGLFDILRKKGFEDFKLAFDLDDPYRQLLRIFFGGREDPDHLLIELILREGILRTPHASENGEPHGNHPVLIIEWICLQNPRASFTSDRPPLPGQEHPGLGIGHEALEFMVLTGMRLKKEGIMNHPQFFHNARFYHEKFRFYNPVQEGRLIAMIRDTGDYNLADAAWALYHECLLDRRTRRKVAWEGGDQVYPLSNELKAYFRSRRYRDRVWETVANTRYEIDWDLFHERMQGRLDS